MMRKAREPVYNQHQSSKPSWQKILQEYGEFQPAAQPMEDKVPEAATLHRRARNNAEQSAAGANAWLPRELRRHPLQAWQHRRRILEMTADTQTVPAAYLDVHAAAIPKKEKGVRPLDFRLLTVFVALYRIEMGAWHDEISGQFSAQIHLEVFGCAQGIEAVEIAWDAQQDPEVAYAGGEEVTISTYDYFKYFDTFDYDLSKQIRLHSGVPARLVGLVSLMWTNSQRRIRQNKALGQPFHAANGLGQGDVLSLLPAIALVSWQFWVLDRLAPSLSKGADIDDRNFRRLAGRPHQSLRHHRRVRHHGRTQAAAQQNGLCCNVCQDSNKDQRANLAATSCWC